MFKFKDCNPLPLKKAPLFPSNHLSKLRSVKLAPTFQKFGRRIILITERRLTGW